MISTVPNICYCSPWAFPLRGTHLPPSFTLTSSGVQEMGVGVTRTTPEPSLLLECAGFPSPFPPPGDLRSPDRLQLGELEPRGKEAVDTARTEVGKEQAFVSGNNRGLGVVYGRSLSGPRLFTKGRISKSPTLLLLEKGTVLRENNCPR